MSRAGHRCARTCCRSWIGAAALAMMTLLSGCSVPKGDAPGGPGPDPGPAPDYAAIRAAQDLRLERLALMRSGGVIELRWTDERGAHFEQGDINLMLHLPNDLALSVNKQVTDPFIWLGSNDRQFWFFDLLDRDASVAWVGAWEDLAEVIDIPGVIHPLRLLDLCGLAVLPAEGTLELDPEEGTWFLDAPGRGGSMRVWFGERHLPTRVDSLDETGTALFSSRLTRYEAVALDDAPRGAFPRLAHRIEIVDLSSSGTALVVLDGATTRIEASKVSNATNLERLITVLRPHRVIDLADDAARRAGE